MSNDCYKPYACEICGRQAHDLEPGRGSSPRSLRLKPSTAPSATTSDAMNPPPLDIVLEIKQTHPIMWSGRSYIKVQVIDRTRADETPAGHGQFIEVKHAAPQSFAQGTYPSADDIEKIVRAASRALRHQLIHHVDP